MLSTKSLLHIMFPVLLLTTALLANGQTALASDCRACGATGGVSADGTGDQYCSDGTSALWCGYVAPSYPVPHPTPPPAGYTHFTYPPMMPHHSLPHYRRIYSYRHGPGLSRTNVLWHPPYLHCALKRIHHIFELPR